MQELTRSIDRRSLPVCPQRAQIIGQCRRFVAVQRIAVGWHVAATLHHLANDLVVSHMGGDVIQSRSAQPAGSTDGMAIAALLVLKDDRALQLHKGPGSPKTSSESHPPSMHS